jgi:hypothetical protein
MGVFEQKASAREALLKGKAQITIDLLLIKIESFVKKPFQYEKELICFSLYKEVNRTYPSASVRLPCLSPRGPHAVSVLAPFHSSSAGYSMGVPRLLSRRQNSE